MSQFKSPEARLDGMMEAVRALRNFADVVEDPEELRKIAAMPGIFAEATANATRFIADLTESAIVELKQELLIKQ